MSFSNQARNKLKNLWCCVGSVNYKPKAKRGWTANFSLLLVINCLGTMRYSVINVLSTVSSVEKMFDTCILAACGIIGGMKLVIELVIIKLDFFCEMSPWNNEMRCVSLRYAVDQESIRVDECWPLAFVLPTLSWPFIHSPQQRIWTCSKLVSMTEVHNCGGKMKASWQLSLTLIVV